MLLTAVLGPLQPGHLGRLCRRQKRQSGGRLKRPGRLGERSGRLWRCGGRERSCGIVTGRRETVCTMVTRKVTESASPRAATRLELFHFVRPLSVEGCDLCAPLPTHVNGCSNGQRSTQKAESETLGTGCRGSRAHTAAFFYHLSFRRLGFASSFKAFIADSRYSTSLPP